MIDKLTPEQEAAIPGYVSKWIGVGLNTDRLNYDRTLDIIHDVQENLLKSAKTPVVIFDNPLECWVACHLALLEVPINDLKKEVAKFFAKEAWTDLELQTFIMPYLSGSFDTSIFSFYDFFQKEVGIDYGDALKNYEIWRATTELGLIFPLDNVCIVSEKPTKISVNEAKVVHCDGGPAISYAGAGDFNIYMLNGVRVPDWLATTKGTSIDIKRYTEITNADIRMEFIRKVGVERMLEMGKKIDSYEKYKQKMWTKSQYELWDMAVLFPGVPYAPHLKMLNQTTGVWHVEAVPPNCRNLKDAIFERVGDIEITGIA